MNIFIIVFFILIVFHILLNNAMNEYYNPCIYTNKKDELKILLLDCINSLSYVLDSLLNVMGYILAIVSGLFVICILLFQVFNGGLSIFSIPILYIITLSCILFIMTLLIVVENILGNIYARYYNKEDIPITERSHLSNFEGIILLFALGNFILMNFTFLNGTFFSIYSFIITIIVAAMFFFGPCDTQPAALGVLFIYFSFYILSTRPEFSEFFSNPFSHISSVDIIIIIAIIIGKFLYDEEIIYYVYLKFVKRKKEKEKKKKTLKSQHINTQIERVEQKDIFLHILNKKEKFTSIEVQNKIEELVACYLGVKDITSDSTNEHCIKYKNELHSFIKVILPELEPFIDSVIQHKCCEKELLEILEAIRVRLSVMQDECKKDIEQSISDKAKEINSLLNQTKPPIHF